MLYMAVHCSLYICRCKRCVGGSQPPNQRLDIVGHGVLLLGAIECGGQVAAAGGHQISIVCDA